MARIIKRLPIQPVERALRAISGRWKALIVYHLCHGETRFSALQTRLPGVTPQVLARQLRELERHGVVARSEHPGNQKQYLLTPLGRELHPVLATLCAWGQAQAEHVGEAYLVRDCVIRAQAHGDGLGEPARDGP